MGRDRGLNNNISKVLHKTIDFARLYLENGLSIIPLKPRSKEPLIPWKEYQEKSPTNKEIEEWFRNNNNNIAIVCGSVSRNLVVIDFDDIEKFKVFLKGVDNLKDSIRFSIANTWWVRTGKGVHVYLRITDIDEKDFKQLFRTKPRLVEGVDVKAEGGYVVAPPSIHPSGRQYEFIQGPPENEIQVIYPDEWKEILKLLGYEEKPKVQVSKESKELSENDILRIVNLLREAYKPGRRDLIILFLTGWLRKANVSYESARKIVELLAENDEEQKHRIYVLDRTYGLKGNPPSKEEFRGKSGLQEILEEALGEERALEVIREIEEILGVSSPFYDSVIELLDYEKQLYAIANLRRLVIARARREGNSLRYKERISPVAPTHVVVYYNPLGGITRYEVTFEGRTLRRPLVIGPAPIEDIAARLKAEGLVYHRRLLDDVLSAIIQAFIRKGRAEIKEEIEAPGFYLVEGKIISVRWEPKDIDKEELKEALKLLNDLATKWYNHVVERFSIVIKWGIIAPFNYIYKQKGTWIPWLYLYGSSYTGKTTLGEIILGVWGLGSRHRKSGSSIDTVPRLGYVLSQSTFPILINEPGSAIYREDVVEVMKSAIESPLARGRYVRGTYTEIPSLAPLIMTSNRTLPRDDALLRRLLVIRFTYGERINPEKAREFEKEIKPKLEKLAAIGYWVAEKIMNKPELLDYDWETLATGLLIQAYKESGLEIPEWVRLGYQVEEDIYEDIRETIRSYLVKRINEEYARFVGRVIVSSGNPEENGYHENYYRREEVDFETRVKVVIENRLLPWAIPKDNEVLLTSDFAREIRSLVGDIGGLKSIAELLGWEYIPKYSWRVGNKVVNKSVIRTSVDSFIEFLK